MVREGLHYYFRVLLPWLVILFILLLVFALIMIVTILIDRGLNGLRRNGPACRFCYDPHAVSDLLLRYGGSL